MKFIKKFFSLLNFYLLISGIKIFFYTLTKNFSKYPNYVKLFEKRVAKTFGFEFAICFSSGTSACFSAIQSLGVNRDSYVYLSKLSFPSTVINVLRAGLNPIYIDFDNNLEPILQESKIEQAYPDVFIISHLYGIPNSQNVLEKLLKVNKNLKVISDCSHAHGAKIKSNLLNDVESISFMSLQGKKAISGGEGGVCLTNSKKLYSNLIRLSHPSLVIEENYDNFPGVAFSGKARIHPFATLIAEAYLKDLSNHNNKIRKKFQLIYSILTNIYEAQLPNISNINNTGGYHYGLPFFYKGNKDILKFNFLKKFNYPKYELYAALNSHTEYQKLLQQSEYKKIFSLTHQNEKLSNDLRDKLFFVDLDWIKTSSFSEIKKNLTNIF